MVISFNQQGNTPTDSEEHQILRYWLSITGMWVYSVMNRVYDIVNPCGNIIIKSDFKQLEIVTATILSF